MNGSAIEHRLVLNDGTSVPQLGLGVFQVKPGETSDTVAAALRVGYRHVDTATLYGNEAEVADGIRRSCVDPSDVHVTTKVWNDEHGRDKTRRAVEKSLTLLDRETLDMYLIHWPAPAQNLYVETWLTLIELRDEGRIKSIGVSNFLPHHLERIIGETGYTPSVNQVELHPYFPQDLQRFINERHGVTTVSWSPLARGKVLGHTTLLDIAAEVRRSQAQVVLRWHVQKGLVVIPRSTSPRRLEENAAVFDWELTAEQVRRIDRMAVDGRIGRHPDDRD